MKLCWYVCVCVDQQSRAEPSIRREQHLDYDAEEVHNLLVHKHNLLVHDLPPQVGPLVAVREQAFGDAPQGAAAQHT